MLSLARYMDVHGISFELHYFARSEKEAAFLPLLRDRCPEKLRAHLGVARQDQDEILGTTFAGMDPGAHVYTCGPDGFMTKVVALAGRHVPAGSIHLENFHAAEQPDASENSAFEVELEGETYQVPADRASSRCFRRTAATWTRPARRASAVPASCRCWQGLRSTGTTFSRSPRRNPARSWQSACPGQRASAWCWTTTDPRLLILDRHVHPVPKDVPHEGADAVGVRLALDASTMDVDGLHAHAEFPGDVLAG